MNNSFSFFFFSSSSSKWTTPVHRRRFFFPPPPPSLFATAYTITLFVTHALSYCPPFSFPQPGALSTFSATRTHTHNQWTLMSAPVIQLMTRTIHQPAIDDASAPPLHKHNRQETLFVTYTFKRQGRSLSLYQTMQYEQPLASVESSDKFPPNFRLCVVVCFSIPSIYSRLWIRDAGAVLTLTYFVLPWLFVYSLVLLLKARGQAQPGPFGLLWPKKN